MPIGIKSIGEPCTPVVCTEERPLFVKMDFPKLTSLNKLPFLFYKFFCY